MLKGERTRNTTKFHFVETTTLFESHDAEVIYGLLYWNSLGVLFFRSLFDARHWKRHTAIKTYRIKLHNRMWFWAQLLALELSGILKDFSLLMMKWASHTLYPMSQTNILTLPNRWVCWRAGKKINHRICFSLCTAYENATVWTWYTYWWLIVLFGIVKLLFIRNSIHYIACHIRWNSCKTMKCWQNLILDGNSQVSGWMTMLNGWFYHI